VESEDLIKQHNLANKLNQPLGRNAKVVPENTRRLHRIET
jgi:hypothetical protein